MKLLKKSVIHFYIILLFGCRINQSRSVISGKITGDPTYKNSIHSFNIMRVIYENYPELGRYKGQTISTSLDYNRRFWGMDYFVLDSGAIIFITHWNERMLFLKFSNHNYKKPSKILLLSNISGDTLQNPFLYKTNLNLTSTRNINVLEVNNGLIFQLDSCLISLDRNMGIKATKRLNSVITELKLPADTKLEFRKIQKIGIGNSFVIRNEKTRIDKSNPLEYKKFKSELLIELNDTLNIIKIGKLPILDFGRWYYHNNYETAIGRDLREAHINSLFPDRNRDSIKIGNKTYKYLTSSKRVTIDDIFKIGSEYYYFSYGFLGKNDSVFKVNNNHFIDYSNLLEHQSPYGYSEQIILDEDISKYIPDSIYSRDNKKYIKNYTMAVEISPKLMIAPIHFTDSVFYDYLSDSLFNRNYIDISVSKREDRSTNINIKLLNNLAIATFKKDYYSTYRLNNLVRYTSPLSSEFSKPSEYSTLFLDSTMSIKSILNSKIGLNEKLITFKSGLATAYSYCNNFTLNKWCKETFNDQNLSILIYDSLRKKDTLIVFIDNYFNYNIYNKYAISAYKSGLKYIGVCNVQFNIEISEIILNESLETNDNNYTIELIPDKNAELTIKTKSNGLFHPIQTQLWMNLERTDSGIYRINNVTRSSDIYNPKDYSFKLYQTTHQMRKNFPAIWEDRFVMLPDTQYKVKLNPGVYFLVTKPIYPENINRSGLDYRSVNNTGVYDRFGRVIYGNIDGTYDDSIFIRHQFKIVVDKNGQIKIYKLRYRQ